MASLRSRLPGVRFAVTTSTKTGWEEARRSATPEDIVLFAPFDYGWICRRFLRMIKPDLVIVLETELWPNLFRETKRAGAGLLLVNGRISDRSVARYRATRFFWRRVLAWPDVFFVQSDRDAERFFAVGAPPECIRSAGNLKFAARTATNTLAESLSDAIPRANLGPVLLAGSTMPGEESFLISAFQSLRRDFPAMWMILAPRHPERCGEVAASVRASDMPLQLRSDWHPGERLAPGIFLLDTTGELASLYVLASAAYIGGTLVPTGGHNILEPAQVGCPVVIGPSMDNFAEISRTFLQAPFAGSIPSVIQASPSIHVGAVMQVSSPAELVTALRCLLDNPSFARQLGALGQQVAARSTGGLEAVLTELEIRLAASAGRSRGPAANSQPAVVEAGPWGRA